MHTMVRTALSAALLIGTATTAAAQERQRGMMGGMRGFAQTLNLWNVLQDENMASDLNLTADQKTKIMALTAAFQKTNAKDLALMETFSEEMAAMRSSGSRPDRNAMMATVEKYREPQENLGKATVQLQADVNAVLSAEQKNILQSKVQTRGPRRRPPGPGN